jgi:uncharacterized membrane protein YqaE (UPF0057 family)
MYLLSILLPPLAILMCKKPTQALLNLFLCLFFWFPGVIHSLLVVKDYKAEKMMIKQVKLMKESIR